MMKYVLRCTKCGDESEDGCFDKNEIIRCVEQSYPLFLLYKTKIWDVQHVESVNYGLGGLAYFICQHFEHGGFEVICETVLERSSIPAILVKPLAPEYYALSMKDAIEDAERCAVRLAELLKGEKLVDPLYIIQYGIDNDALYYIGNKCWTQFQMKAMKFATKELATQKLAEDGMMLHRPLKVISIPK